MHKNLNFWWKNAKIFILVITPTKKKTLFTQKKRKILFLKKSICGESWKNIHSDYWPASGEVEKPLNQGRAWEGGTGAGLP